MYSLNNISLADYGIIAGRAKDSNIAVSGIFDLPKRIGQTFQSWDDEDGIEPFVDADEIFLAGRDIDFYGLIKGSRNDIVSAINSLKHDVAAFTDLVVFSTEYGDYNVKIEKIDSEIMNGMGTVTIKMREPQPDLSGGVFPVSAPGSHKVDNMPLQSFGMYVSKIQGRGDQAKMDKEYFTVYDKEGYQVTGRKAVEISISGFVEGADKTTFQANIKALWKLFTDPGLRKVKLNDYVTIESFVTDGFIITGVHVASNKVIGSIFLKLIACDEYIPVYSPSMTGNKVLTTMDGKIIVYG